MEVIHIITGLNDGGAEASLVRLCIADKKNKHRVISLMGFGKYGPVLRDNNITVDTLNMQQGKFTFRGFYKLYKILKECKPSAVQTWMYHADLIGGVAARFVGIKNISWGIHHSNLTPGDCKKSTIYIAKLCGYLSSFIPKNIICCADASAKVHSNIGYCQSKLKVIYNGYELDLFNDKKIKVSHIKSEFNIPDSIILLGMVGRFHPFKDHENLIQALGLLKAQSYDFKCLLVGQGITSDNKNLVNWLISNNVKDDVILAGARDDIPDIMNAIDIHLLSSSSEAFPNVLNEAMACGTPCVSTDVGDASLIIGSTGWVVSPKDSEELAKGIILALTVKDSDLNDWDLRKKQSRARVERNFSIASMVKKYDKIWRDEK